MAHEPPVQANSTSGEAKWYSDWKWMNPFSSSITLDEDRSVLPPLSKRPPIYTFYDTSTQKDEASRDAESKILLAWRRAWWAQGFRPVVLGRPEAMNNPFYERLQGLKLETAMESELVRWLAWGHMGTGILANWLAFPMASHEDHLLTYLRRGEYPKLTRYEGLGSGLFCGEKTAINAALKKALENPDVTHSKSIIDAVPRDDFDVDPEHSSIAFYDATTITTKYKVIAEKLAISGSEGLALLPQLINSHLHTIFQNEFSEGIAVLHPLPKFTTALVEPALQIAHHLAQCSDSPIPSSCPPNRPKCRPCLASHPLPIDNPPTFRNTSTRFIIATVPHPYTLTSMTSQRETLDVRFIRRNTDRDTWITSVTKALLGTGMGGPGRIVRLKAAVASEWGHAHSLWLPAEAVAAESESPSAHDKIPVGLDWHFGFTLPLNDTDKGHSNTPVPGPERQPPKPAPKVPPPSPSELASQKNLLDKARAVLEDSSAPKRRVRAMVEGWNLADTEAWRFVRALRAREEVERRKWEEEERKFAGGAGADGGEDEGWGGWFDRRGT
ncbi:MAG: hypothetical protein M1819_002183 [Sarea resinae]|nr:MAG: hypothetical protein M1819_002183 [Sarea resinae]